LKYEATYRPPWRTRFGRTMDRPVVTQTTEGMYLNTVWKYREQGHCRRIECHKLHTFFTPMLPGNYNDRWGRNEN